MRSQDITKLANDKHFEVYRINRASDNLYILKRMNVVDVPCWEIVNKGSSVEDMMAYCHSYHAPERYPLVCSETFSTFDLIEISKRGFSILRESENNDSYDVQSYNKETLTWNNLNSFAYLYERTAFMNKQLMNSTIIAVD